MEQQTMNSTRTARPRAWLVGFTFCTALATAHCASNGSGTPAGGGAAGDSNNANGDSNTNGGTNTNGSAGGTRGDAGKAANGAGARDGGKAPAKGSDAGGSTTSTAPGADAPSPVAADGPTMVDNTSGRWRTALDEKTGRFTFIDPDNKPAVLRGISMTGIETGTRETNAGAGFWLFLSNQMPEATNAPKVLTNVVKTLASKWQTDVLRLPICGSAWTQNYVVRDWSSAKIANYQDWVDIAIKAARAAGKVVIIDNHLWAIAKMGNGGGVDRGSFTSNGQTHKYSEYEDGCTGVNKVGSTDSCAPKDWFTDDPMKWECAIANADGVSMYNAYKNKDNIGTMWADIAERYKDDSGVWFELLNEPYTRKATQPFPHEGENEEEKDYPWDLWSEYMQTQITAIRDKAQAKNIIVVNGLDWGYDFGPEYGPIAFPDKYMPWRTKYANIAYAFHPYQHGACCGQIGNGDTDLSATDPYESGFCSYYKDGSDHGAASGAPLPGGKSCTNNGYAATQDKKMPPCTWVDAAYNPKTKANGLCAGDRRLCGDKSKADCQALDRASPQAGGWSKYAFPMTQYGPLIATEFGSFDCSSGYVKTLLSYMREYGISYTAWALWPQNSGGPEGLGSCGYPAVIKPVADPGDFRGCFDAGACASVLEPMPWSGKATFDDLSSH
jgi:Cellulase (glycosyl hydrolase family 5)